MSKFILPTQLGSYSLTHRVVVSPVTRMRSEPDAIPGDLMVAAGGFTRASTEAIIEAGKADLVAFGRRFIANPDLPERFQRGLPLNRYDRSTLYGGGARGYTDDPVFSKTREAA